MLRQRHEQLRLRRTQVSVDEIGGNADYCERLLALTAPTDEATWDLPAHWLPSKANVSRAPTGSSFGKTTRRQRLRDDDDGLGAGLIV